MLIPGVTPLPPSTSIAPLIFVLAVSAVKEAYEDFRRMQGDRELNRRPAQVVRAGQLVTVRYEDVRVGDILYVESNQEIAADAILLAAHNGGSTCYVETSNLDGETNLKLKTCLPATAGLATIQEMSEFRACVVCQRPEPSLYQFQGQLIEGDGVVHPLTPPELLLRGSRLKNTPYVLALVVCTGPDTKLVLNKRPAPSKQSHVELRLNRYLIGIFVVLLLMCLGSCAGGAYYAQNVFVRQSHVYLAVPSLNTWAEYLQSIVFQFLTFVVLYNTFIPLSLYVTVELQRFFGAMWLEKDLEMYDEETSSACQCHTSNLLEELGQIQHAFCDKTGTLTANDMVFQQVSINGTVYNGNYNHRSTHASAGRLSDLRDIQDHAVTHEFLIALGLCHSVFIRHGQGSDFEYEASSPDEYALILGARANGVEFVGREAAALHLKAWGSDVSYELLHTLDFDSVRKCMSVIIRESGPKGRVIVYTKGADSQVFRRLGDSTSADQLRVTQQNLDTFARDGFRTLAVARRVLDEEWYLDWAGRYREAEASLVDRAAKRDAMIHEVEAHLELLGATAIEDKLQDGVPDTIETLIGANIKVWVLTGDKMETAINIGYACRLFNPSMTVMHLRANNAADAAEVIEANHETIARARAGSHFGLVVDGEAGLDHALTPALKHRFLELCKKCQGVLCCRSSPLQKALVVSLVKTCSKGWERPITLAIGDGANDVSMIQEADVGVGLVGKEGTQAARSADYAIGKFRFLKRLALVHGRYSYLRITTLIQYSFYKNIAFCLLQFYYAFYNGFSGQTLFDGFLVTMFNICFTFWPIMVYGLFEKDVEPEFLMRYPRLFHALQKGCWFNPATFTVWMLTALWHSVAMYWGTQWFFNWRSTYPDGQMEDLYVFGTAACAFSVVVVNAKIMLETQFHTWINFLGIFITVAGYWVLTYIYSAWNDEPTDMYWVAMWTNASPSFWLGLLAITGVCLLPDYLVKAYFRTFKPELWQIANEHQQTYSKEERRNFAALPKPLSVLSDEEDSLIAASTQKGGGRRSYGAIV